jgi:16S rRNA A1518/A1519 N6-dimethyltransferase RsmA/KsgA/DIM1 with predicted DNA glycosylase/AP lyase activity
LKVPKNDILPLLEKAGIDPQRRAETLTIDEWGVLYRAFKSNSHG